MGYKPIKLGHINIFVRNAERARDWYEDLLGLHTYGFRPGRAAFMTADLGNSHEIALTEVGEDAPSAQQRQVGLNHMASSLEGEGQACPEPAEGMRAIQFGVTAAVVPSRGSSFTARKCRFW